MKARKVVSQLISRGYFWPLCFLMFACLLGFNVGQFSLVHFSLWIIYGMLALSLEFVWGQVGIFSFGQTAIFGVAGYTYGVVCINLASTHEAPLLGLVVAILLTTVFSVTLGYFMFYGRVSDVYLGIITLAVTLVLLTFIGSTADPKYTIGNARLGGYNGLSGIQPFGFGIGSLSPLLFYLFLVVMAVGMYLCVKMLMKSPLGKVLKAIKDNEVRTELLGYDVRWYKLVSFAIGGIIAAFAGAMFASWGLFIDPSVFSLTMAASVVVWVLVGGRGTLAGAFLGTVVVQGLSDALGGYTNQSTLVLGVLLIGIVLIFPKGLIPLMNSILSRTLAIVLKGSSNKTIINDQDISFPKGEAFAQFVLSSRGEENTCLEVRDLGIMFDGLEILSGVSIKLEKGIHCIIGPNGAGKSTLFNLLIGRYKPTRGRIFYMDKDITQSLPYQRARIGIGVKMQIANIYQDLSVEDNLWLATYSVTRNRNKSMEIVYHVLPNIGLTDYRTHLARSLSHGQQQWLEMGMVLASGANIMLFDEPTAGMTREETLETAKLIRNIAKFSTVVVVEHDMEFVRELQSDITVLHQGRIFKSGTMDTLRQDNEILDIYLGRRNFGAAD